MPKYNPKRKARGQGTEKPPSSTPEKQAGTYKRGTPNLTKFYALIIIAAMATGMVFLFTSLFSNLPPAIAQWDHVQLHLRVWYSPTVGKWNESSTPDYENTQWYNFTTIYEPSTDTNASVNKYGLPLGIYDKVSSFPAGGQSPAFMIMNCIDSNKDKKDDTTGEPANGWGFIDPNIPASSLFYNKTIIVKFEVLAVDPHT